MRPLSHNKTHGIIHTVKPEDLDKVANVLGIDGKDKERLMTGEIHIVREAGPEEINPNK